MTPGDGAHSPGLAYGTAAGRWVLAVTVLGSAIGFLDTTAVNVALPKIGEELGADLAGLQWTVNGYLLTLAALILLGGSLGDRFGRRRVFVIGVVWFSAASLVCALAPSIGTLVAARVLQGVGGALVTPGSLAIIEATFRPRDRARAIGAWSGLSGLATAAGPLLGGYLVDALSWRWIFLINLPVGGFVALVGARHIPETSDEQAAGRPDVPGAVLATLGLAGVTFAFIEAAELGFGSPVILVALVAGGLSLAAFGLVERRVASPMLPLEIFSSRQFTAANGVTLVVYAALGGVLFLLTVFLQNALGYSPLEAGAATLPITVLLLALSSRMGNLGQKIGPRLPLTVGPFVLGGSMLLMTTIEPGDSYFVSVMPVLVVFGLGLSAVVAPVTATALAAAGQHNSGIASAINNAVSRMSQLVAVAALPAIAGLSGADYQRVGALTEGFHVAMVAAAVLATVGGIFATATIRNEVLTERGPAAES